MAETPNIIGIDLGFKSIKVCQVKRSQKSFEVIALNKEDMNGDLLNDESEQGVELVSKKIIEACEKAKTTTKNCVITIPETLVFSRLISLPDMPEENLSEAIFYSLKPVIPVPLENVNVSFLEVSRINNNNKIFVNWYVVAAPKTQIEKYEKYLKKAGLNLLAIETEALANTRAVASNYQISGDALILDFGAQSSNIILVRNQNTAFSQTIELGSEMLTKSLSSDFGMDIIQAENLKITYGIDPNAGNGRIIQSLTPTLDALVTEISRTIAYYKDKLGGSSISKIFLVGGGSSLKNLDSYINSKLSIECIKVDSFRAFEVNKNIRQVLESTKLISDYNVALGLSLKSFFNA